MTDYNLHDIYDLATEKDEKKEVRNFRFLGEIWNFQILDDEVIGWKLNAPGETEATFTIDEDMSVLDFEEEIEEWMRNYTNL